MNVAVLLGSDGIRVKTIHASVNFGYKCNTGNNVCIPIFQLNWCLFSSGSGQSPERECLSSEKSYFRLCGRDL